MTQPAKQWLAAVPWESVVTLNQALCQAQKLEPNTSPKMFQKAQKFWQTAVPRPMSLREALEVCHDAHCLGPFVFNNGNTFAALGHTLVDSLLKSLPPVEAQILRTTIGHYICDLIGRRELLQVLKHLEPMLERQMQAPLASAPAPAPAPAAAQTPAVGLGLPRGQSA